MTRAANCADGALVRDMDVQPLIERLCRTEADIVYFPVRHHSPVGAWLVSELIRQLRPTAVLVEGPSDFNHRMDELLLEHELPIAIYSYFRTAGTHSGAYYPFCDYSPEWSALRAGRRVGATLQFIDLPWTAVARHDRVTHRYADAELRRSRYVRSLCEQFRVEEFDDLWDLLIESRDAPNLQEYLERTHSLCFHIRLFDDSVSVSDRQREAFMAQQIRNIRQEAKGAVLVVTGGYHSSALAARLEGFSCPGTDDDDVADDQHKAAPDVTETGIALTSYSYERLDSLTGYNAGMPNPGFYDHAWQQRNAGRNFDHRPLLTELIRELRERRQTLSTADLIAVETGARALAALRGRTHVWRRDLVDAVTSSLIKDELEYGCESPFVAAIHAVLRGHKRGRLAEGTRMPPLVLDIQRQLQAENLEMTGGIRDAELDLLAPDDLRKSRVLHRLKVLGIMGYERTGGTDFLTREDLSKIRESWRIRWSPEFEATCIEASRYGTSLADAAAARLAEAAGEHQANAAAAAALLVQAAQAGCETISDVLLDRLSGLIQGESQFTAAATALGHILFLYFHDEALGTTRLPQPGRLLTEAFGRSLWLLEMLGASAGNEKTLLRGMKSLLEVVQRGGESLDLDRGEFIAVMSRVERDPGKPSSARGAAAGILWTLEAADDQQILSDLLGFAAPSDLGDFLAGLFALARELAQRHARLVQTIDRLLNEFGADDFQASLPALRLAFTWFTPREKHHMLTTLFESSGLKAAEPLAPLMVSESTAAEVLAFEERLFETLNRYGLEEPHD